MPYHCKTMFPLKGKFSIMKTNLLCCRHWECWSSIPENAPERLASAQLAPYDIHRLPLCSIASASSKCTRVVPIVRTSTSNERKCNTEWQMFKTKQWALKPEDSQCGSRNQELGLVRKRYRKINIINPVSPKSSTCRKNIRPAWT